MTLFQQALLLCTLACPALSMASDIPRSLVPENVIVCAPSAGCTNETLFGRTYKVLATSRYTVKISLSNEGAYTRADISVTNNTSYPLNLSPEDFRVEVVKPKPKVLLYVAPSDLKDMPPSLPASAQQAKATPVAITVPPVSTPLVEQGSTDELAIAAKQKVALAEVIEKAAAQKDLAAVSISPNEVTRGRVYFERDKKSRDVNIVLPIAGVVFEFPYVLPR